MYSRGFGNSIEHDSAMYEQEHRYEEAEPISTPAAQCGLAPKERRRGFSLGKLFSDINTEDLLLIAIALLLLLDGDPDNDILLIAIAFILFF